MATTNPLMQQIDVVAKDKGIDPAIVIGAFKTRYLAASRKVFKSDETADALQPRPDRSSSTRSSDRRRK